jgi:hypothetical protein
MIFSQERNLGDHIQAKHQEDLLDQSVSDFTAWSTIQSMGIRSCPLCSSEGPTDSPELVSHVMQHAYEFALRALPWPKEADEDMNKPIGTYSLPEKQEDAKRLELWMNECNLDSTIIKGFQLSSYDIADHAFGDDFGSNQHTDYFTHNDYFEDQISDNIQLSSRDKADLSFEDDLDATKDRDYAAHNDYFEDQFSLHSLQARTRSIITGDEFSNADSSVKQKNRHSESQQKGDNGLPGVPDLSRSKVVSKERSRLSAFFRRLRGRPQNPGSDASSLKVPIPIPIPQGAPTRFEVLSIPEIVDKSPSLPEHLWDRAYDELKENETSEATLVHAYEKILSRHLRDRDPASDSNVGEENIIAQDDPSARRAQMKQLVTSGLAKIKGETKIKDSLDKGVQVVMSAKDIISSAIQSIPQAALAWVGVCVALEV